MLKSAAARQLHHHDQRPAAAAACSSPTARLPAISNSRWQQQQQQRLSGIPPPKQHCRLSLATMAQGGAGSASSGGPSHAGRAVLHDFCMTIPFSGIALVAAVVAALLKAPAVGLQLAGAGAAIAACSVLSLRTWKAGGSSVPFTLASAGAAGWVAWGMWQRVAAGVAPLPHGVLLGLSAALAAFCVYNVLAGGNPPRNSSSKAE